MKKVAFLSVMLVLTGCEAAFDAAFTEIGKAGLEEACGEENSECLLAVDSQFSFCHEQYRKEWKDYMVAGFSEEDEKLDIYMEKIALCIVDEEGIPYFEFASSSS